MEPKFRKIVWTEHSKIKMRQYGLSASKLLQILHKPERKEKAIVEGLVAVMKTNKKFINKTLGRSPRPSAYGQGPTGEPKPLIKPKKYQPSKFPGEIWIMYKDFKKAGESTRKIISAWRYPGVTKPGEAIPIPEDIKEEILNNKY